MYVADPAQDPFTLDLSGPWRFKADPSGTGETLGYARADHDDGLWREVGVPCCIDNIAPEFEDYEGRVWFRRRVYVPLNWAERRVYLEFGAINYHAKIWINGEPVGGAEDGHLPVSIRTPRWRHGENNLIVVRCDNLRHAGELPGQDLGWRTFAGILREPRLRSEDPCHLEDVRIETGLEGTCGRLKLQLKVGNGRRGICETVIQGHIFGPDGSDAANLAPHRVRIDGGQSEEFFFSTEVWEALPWTPDTPMLYDLRLELIVDGEPVDQRHYRIGFRGLTIRRHRLWLNASPLYLTGFNRHEDSPTRNAAWDPDITRADLGSMKAAGANCVRLAHYPQHPGVLDICDEIGLLAIVEIPLYWWRGYDEGRDAFARKKAAARRQLEATIARDRHHASIIGWCVSNECREDYDEVAEGIAQLVNHARELDPSRPAFHVSNRWHDKPRFEADDIICINNYPSVWPDAGVIDRDGYQGLTMDWRARMETLHGAYPDKPILVTEFGHPSYLNERGGLMGEDSAARALVAQFNGMDASYVCGALVWCWADHAWPAHEWQHMARTRFSPFGVVSRNRRPKLALNAIREAFLKRQGQWYEEKAPTRAVSGPAGFNVFMVRDHLSEIPDTPFPDGFAIRPMHREDVALWADIQRDAEEYFIVNEQTFEMEFGGDWEAVSRRCFIITDPHGRGVGVVGAWYHRTFKGKDHGQIHWLAVRQGARGLGLGRAGLAFALRQLGQWHARACLQTQTKRYPAIQLYLRYGFRPDLDPPGAREAWESIRNTIPLLQAYV